MNNMDYKFSLNIKIHIIKSLNKEKIFYTNGQVLSLVITCFLHLVAFLCNHVFDGPFFNEKNDTKYSNLRAKSRNIRNLVLNPEGSNISIILLYTMKIIKNHKLLL